LIKYATATGSFPDNDDDANDPSNDDNANDPSSPTNPWPVRSWTTVTATTSPPVVRLFPAASRACTVKYASTPAVVWVNPMPYACDTKGATAPSLTVTTKGLPASSLRGVGW
jgi:hypothetical protein